MLDKRYSYQIRCEDKQTQCFLRYFLDHQGVDIKRRVIFLPLAPNTCAESYVRKSFPDDLKKYRALRKNKKTCLIVVIDADQHTCQVRENQIQKDLLNHNLRIEKDDFLLLWIPKRNIESWIKYYLDGSSDEKKDHKHFLKGRESECKPAAIKMSSELVQNLLINAQMTSLCYAQKEYNKICNLQDVK